MVVYKQNFSMPVIGPPTSGSVSVTAATVGRYGLEVQVGSASDRQLFTMAGGAVYFVPVGSDPFLVYQAYEDLPPLAPGTGYVLQRIWMVDTRTLQLRLPVGVPPMVDILYFNVDPVSFRADAELALQAAPLSRRVLKSFGALPPTADLAAYQTQLLDLMLEGKAGLLFPGGSPVGSMASNSFTLFFTCEDFVGVSPIPYLRNLPELAGAQWLGHPLISAVSAIPVPIDIYAQFNVWSSLTNQAEPLPDGLPVRLINYNPISSETLDQQTLSGGTGSVAFNLPASQTQEAEPDLLFEIDLGTSNPEPSMIIDPWDSSAQGGKHTLGSSLGYFDDFTGTRLGSAIAPLQYLIGLGPWQYLINQRPSVALQAALEAQGRFGQPIESSYHDAPISLDYYGVRISQLPKLYPTAKELMDHVRTNFDRFYSHSVSVFRTDDPAWGDADASPVGVVLEIDFKLFDIPGGGGSVVVSGHDYNGGFTVNTISDPGIAGSRWYHPLGGIRHWGIVANPDGSFTLFTQGADRPFLQIDHINQDLIFSGADRLWTSFHLAVEKFVNSNGGTAQTLPVFAERFKWGKVADLYWLDDPTNPWLTPS